MGSRCRHSSECGLHYFTKRLLILNFKVGPVETGFGLWTPYIATRKMKMQNWLWKWRLLACNVFNNIFNNKWINKQNQNIHMVKRANGNNFIKLWKPMKHFFAPVVFVSFEFRNSENWIWISTFVIGCSFDWPWIILASRIIMNKREKYAAKKMKSKIEILEHEKKSYDRKSTEWYCYVKKSVPHMINL